MRVLIGFLCMLLLSLSFTACAQKTDNKPLSKNIGSELLKPDSTIIASLGNMATSVLFSPDKVSVYELEPKKEVAKDDYEAEPHFVRKTYIGNLDKQMISVVNCILIGDPNSYDNDTISVQTFYLPLIELEYKKKKDIVNVIISPNDGTWTVISDGKKQFNHSFKNPKLINRIINSFLNIKSTDKKQ